MPQVRIATSTARRTSRVATFDYTMQFDYGENAIEGHDVDPSE